MLPNFTRVYLIKKATFYTVILYQGNFSDDHFVSGQFLDDHFVSGQFLDDHFVSGQFLDDRVYTVQPKILQVARTSLDVNVNNFFFRIWPTQTYCL